MTPVISNKPPAGEPRATAQILLDTLFWLNNRECRVHVNPGD